jgi:tripartite-type tricarboxylate transporter receptor subunit TctC
MCVRFVFHVDGRAAVSAQYFFYKEYTAAAQVPGVQKFLTEQGLVYVPNTQNQFAARIEAESARWGKIVRAQNIKVE